MAYRQVLGDAESAAASVLNQGVEAGPEIEGSGNHPSDSAKSSVVSGDGGKASQPARSMFEATASAMTSPIGAAMAARQRRGLASALTFGPTRPLPRRGSRPWRHAEWRGLSSRPAWLFYGNTGWSPPVLRGRRPFRSGHRRRRRGTFTLRRLGGPASASFPTRVPRPKLETTPVAGDPPLRAHVLTVDGLAVGAWLSAEGTVPGIFALSDRP